MENTSKNLEKKKQNYYLTTGKEIKLDGSRRVIRSLLILASTRRDIRESLRLITHNDGGS